MSHVGEGLSSSVQSALGLVPMATQKVVLSLLLSRVLRVAARLHFPLGVQNELLYACNGRELLNLGLVIYLHDFQLLLLRLHVDDFTSVVRRQAIVSKLLQALGSCLIGESIE